MDTLNKLLDSARKMCPSDSDNSLSKVLGVTRSAVSMWRSGGKVTDEHLAKLIELAQADPALFVRVRQEEAETPAQKKLWGPLWDRLSPVTTVIGAMVLAIGMMPATSRANPININNLHVPTAHSLYIMSGNAQLTFYLTAPLSSCNSRLNGTSGGGLAVAG
ncbi:hypothetical protein BI317_12255 [Xanthomonas hortorum pv. gardneri]|uniref:DUF3693 domain-containing protein n=1 Tax=Xanthomonas hortorum TaxID=56454 RepID=UPI0009381B90|nr:DUF3693 domain-containing protein [Xanthomonas hortorum]APP84818.1 hypothetical protein BI317_12255 [Xanthomonas hortorum pv. gardneri]